MLSRAVTVVHLFPLAINTEHFHPVAQIALRFYQPSLVKIRIRYYRALLIAEFHFLRISGN